MNKKAKKDRKEEVIRLRVTAEQKALMTEAAKKLGLDISAWLRTLGVQQARHIEYVERSQIAMPGQPAKAPRPVPRRAPKAN